MVRFPSLAPPYCTIFDTPSWKAFPTASRSAPPDSGSIAAQIMDVTVLVAQARDQPGHRFKLLLQILMTTCYTKDGKGSKQLTRQSLPVGA